MDQSSVKHATRKYISVNHVSCQFWRLRDALLAVAESAAAMWHVQETTSVPVILTQFSGDERRGGVGNQTLNKIIYLAKFPHSPRLLSQYHNLHVILYLAQSNNWCSCSMVTARREAQRIKCDVPRRMACNRMCRWHRLYSQAHLKSRVPCPRDCQPVKTAMHGYQSVNHIHGATCPRFGYVSCRGVGEVGWAN